MRRILIGGIVVGIPILLAFAFMEILLRAAPSLVSLSVLDKFPTELKKQVARRLELPSAEDFVVIPSAKRFDKGFDLFVPAPNARFFTPADEIDKQLGAIEWVQVDDNGFCNDAVLNTSESADIVVLGGSVPSCTAVEVGAIFSHQLSRLMGKKVYDMTVGGVGPFEYLEVLKHFGLKLQPQAVVMAFSDVNDLRDCKRHLDHVGGKTFTPHAQREWPWPFTASYALAYLKGSIGILVKGAKASSSPDFRFSVSVNGAKVDMNSRNGEQDTLESALLVSQGKLDVGLCETALADFVETGRKHSFVPVVMLTPAIFEIYNSSVEFANSDLKSLMDDYIEKQREWLRSNADRLGYTFVDGVEKMRALAKTGDLQFFRENTHLTAKGHQALAESTYTEISAALAR